MTLSVAYERDWIEHLAGEKIQCRMVVFWNPQDHRGWMEVEHRHPDGTWHTHTTTPAIDGTPRCDEGFLDTGSGVKARRRRTE